MDKIKKLIIIIIILIVGLIIAIVFLKKEEKNNPDLYVSDEDLGFDETVEIDESDISIVSFYKVKNCIQAYLNAINLNNSSYYNEEQTLITNDAVKEKIYNMLSSKYIQENSIKQDNVYKYVNEVKEDYIFNILDIKKKDYENNITQYITYGYIQNLENEFINYGYFIINMDELRNIFSIEPINYKVNSIEDIKFYSTDIDKKDSNIISSVDVSAENICYDYLTSIKRLMLMLPEEAYNILDKIYKEERFENIDNFKEYIDKNRNEISELILQGYKLNMYDDYNEYICKDQYENEYIIIENSICDYELKLDRYTVKDEEFKELYNSAKDKEKLAINIELWVQMLNRRDYKTAYKVLDETFRKNNFGTEEAFENYMREYFPLHYKIEYGDSTEQNGIYTQDIILKDISNSDQNTIQKTIIMQLKDDYNFVMSFNV